MTIRVIHAMCAGWLCLACSAPAEDGRDDQFLADGKADAWGITEDSADARGVLRVANELTADDLEDQVGLGHNTATAIYGYRAGDDELVPSHDDETIDTLGELDTIPYVGKIAFRALLVYARDHGFVEGCVARCEGDTRVSCIAGAEVHDICPQGCRSGQCRPFTISNLDDATVRAVYLAFPPNAAGLEIPDSAEATIDANTGAIAIDGVQRRQAGVGFSWDGLGFFRNADLGDHVLSVKKLRVGRNAKLSITTTTLPLVILSHGDIAIEGTIEIATTTQRGTGKGADTSNNRCYPAPGPGGGANGTPGCAGASITVQPCGLPTFCNQTTPCPCGAVISGGAGGMPINTPTLQPLRGGDAGGSAYISTRVCKPDPFAPSDLVEGFELTRIDAGGAGGGAVQLTSLTRIMVTRAATTAPVGIDAPGGKGVSGGAGGSILLEAPQIDLRPDTVVAANGGDITHAGAFGLASSSCINRSSGGGAGRIRINTLPGGLSRDGAVISPPASFGQLTLAP